MDIQKIHHYKSAFDLIAKSIKDDAGNTIEVWYARELQQVLGYARWENFVVAIGRAMESCKTLGVNVDDHFREVTKMIALAKGPSAKFNTLCLCSMDRQGHQKGPIGNISSARLLTMTMWNTSYNRCNKKPCIRWC